MADIVKKGAFGDLSINQLTPYLQSAGASVASTLGRAYAPQLKAIGSRIVKESVASASQSVPAIFRPFYLTQEEIRYLKYRDDVSIPEWVKSITTPIINPVLDGVKQESENRLAVLLPRVMVTVSLGILTIFSVGYIVGIKRGRKTAFK